MNTTTNTTSTADGTLPGRLLSTQELADYLGASPWYVRELVRKGVLTPRVRLGTMWRFDLDEVLAQLARAGAEERE
jgi:excisionase family DNA binding protein